MEKAKKKQWFWRAGGVAALTTVLISMYNLGRDVGATDQREKTNRVLIETLDAKVGVRLDKIEKKVDDVQDQLSALYRDMLRRRDNEDEDRE